MKKAGDRKCLSTIIDFEKYFEEDERQTHSYPLTPKSKMVYEDFFKSD